ncbi:hypothetical protein SS1G_01796 [Sclerotinia sclerotiorum 1980 UF-70]|uniref:Aminotransferase class I/classII domain-containing protein n=1 Tax=Sclerotinia sclerotiorum (strain ATCC 18683 / 1980 / Ss-1) TaxID=665079 RepID=A7E918_SCLS1|nr:hypothetical protein SS1G_01796 [Sclerotinia sclerotiorum 1980 UF-70]EDN96870.1 hypothetical protein SS1G_01796 [Sclerotinia sclerotiorum 1980 UF-70]
MRKILIGNHLLIDIVGILVSHSKELLSSLIIAYDTASEPSRIRAVVLCDPRNSFSRCYTKDYLEACQKFRQERGLHLISDEFISTLSSLYLRLLLDSPRPPRLIETNSDHLTTSYKLFADSPSKWKIKFLPAMEGIFIFAKLAPDARTQEEADEIFSQLAKNGVFVSL